MLNIGGYQDWDKIKCHQSLKTTQRVHLTLSVIFALPIIFFAKFHNHHEDDGHRRRKVRLFHNFGAYFHPKRKSK